MSKITRNFIDEIPEDLYEGVFYIVDGYFESQAQRQDHTLSVKYLDLLEAYLRKKEQKFRSIEIIGEPVHDIKQIQGFFKTQLNIFNARKTKESILSLRGKYDVILGNSFTYKFTNEEIDRIKEIISELKDQITQNKQFSPEHKRRLLKRLEVLESELQNEMPEVDGYWGLMGEAGVAKEMYGEDADQLFQLVKDIMEIVWRSQSNAAQLESGTKMNFLKDWEE